MKKIVAAIAVALVCLWTCRAEGQVWTDDSVVFVSDGEITVDCSKYDKAADVADTCIFWAEIRQIDPEYWAQLPCKDAGEYVWFKRIPDRWEMRVDTSEFLIGSALSGDALITVIDTTYMPKKMMFWTEEDIRKFEKLLLEEKP